MLVLMIQTIITVGTITIMIITFCRGLVSKSVLADSAFLNSRLCSMSAMICHDVGLESLGFRHDRELGCRVARTRKGHLAQICGSEP